MNMQLLSPGERAPLEINVIIEIPAFSEPVKYEVDKKTGLLRVDRFMSTTMRYPTNYGYVPNTLGLDGDPLDALVITPYPINSGAIITVRPIGVINMTDEAGSDAKIIAVPTSKVCSMYDRMQSPEDMPPLLLEQLIHFFEHYKDLEPNKWVKIEGVDNAAAAHKIINESIEAYRKTV